LNKLNFPVAKLIKPFEQTAYLTQLNFIHPVYSHRMVYIPGVYNVEAEVIARAEAHADKLIEVLQKLEGTK